MTIDPNFGRARCLHPDTNGQIGHVVSLNVQHSLLGPRFLPTDTKDLSMMPQKNGTDFSL